MLTLGGKIVLGIIGTITSLYLSFYFIYKCLEEKEAKISFKYLLLSVGNMLSLIFITNMI
ncbi:hypothetical protein GZ981_000594 [Clostridium perfringens]